MPYFPKLEEWQSQSALLLRARPTTTRITTKYHIPSASTSTSTTKPSTTTTDPTEPQQQQPPTSKAYLELKTYDPVSGVTLKYKTDKAAEVGRLIASMGTLGRDMAALPVLKSSDVAMTDAPASGVETPVPETTTAAAAPTTEKPSQAPSGTKKKKKGGKK